MSTDYSKWDSLAADVDAEELQEKQQRRVQNQERYYKEQHEAQQRQQKQQPATQGKSNDHDHSHERSADSKPADSAATAQVQLPRKPRCGCGFTDVAELKQLETEWKQRPQITIEEKNSRKLTAVRESKTHGNHLYAQGDYLAAISIYEHGLLILTGMYDVTDAEQQELDALEIVYHLNLAQCFIKTEDYMKARTQCKLVLQLDEKNVKAMYRLAVTYVHTMNYDEAEQLLTQVLAVESNNSDALKLRQRINELHAAGRKSEQHWQQSMAERMKDMSLKQQQSVSVG